MMILVEETSKHIILYLTADEVDRIKGVTEYGGDYKQLNYKLIYGKPKRLAIRDISTLDLISYIVEEERDNIDKQIKQKLDAAYTQMRSVREQKEETDLYNKYYSSSIPSRFDKWISIDFGDVPSILNNSVNYQGESWNFAGRQPDGTYAFVRTYPKPQEVIFAKKFSDVAQYVALPGRRY